VYAAARRADAAAPPSSYRGRHEAPGLPLGRRGDGIPLLLDKFRTNLARRFDKSQQQRILDASSDQVKLGAMRVDDYVSLYVV